MMLINIPARRGCVARRTVGLTELPWKTAENLLATPLRQHADVVARKAMTGGGHRAQKPHSGCTIRPELRRQIILRLDHGPA
jgi:hypothetical protein